MRGEPSREQNERNHDETDERANDEAQQQGETVFASPEIFDQIYNARIPRSARYVACSRIRLVHFHVELRDL